MTVERIRCTCHAVNNARTRFRNINGFPTDGTHAQVARYIGQDVAHAIHQGRIAKRIPVWATRPGGKRNNVHHQDGRRTRCVWDPDETRLYVIVRTRGAVLVITAIVRAEIAPPVRRVFHPAPQTT